MNAVVNSAHGACSLCGATDELNETICATCTVTRELAPEVVANLLSLGMGSVVELDGTRIDLASPLAVGLITRKLSERHRKLGPASLFDWAGAVSFPGAGQPAARIGGKA